MIITKGRNSAMLIIDSVVVGEIYGQRLKKSIRVQAKQFPVGRIRSGAYLLVIKPGTTSNDVAENPKSRVYYFGTKY